jgi:hypothetical protein
MLVTSAIRKRKNQAVTVRGDKSMVEGRVLDNNFAQHGRESLKEKV